MNPNLSPTNPGSGSSHHAMSAQAQLNEAHSQKSLVSNVSAVPSRIAGVSVAVLLALVGITLRWMFLPMLGSSTPFILVAIIVSAWYGGLWPGLLTTSIVAIVALLFPTMMTSTAVPASSSTVTFFFSVITLGTLISLLQESLHRAHRHVSRTARKLSESNKQFLLLVDSVEDYGIFMLDPDGNVASWNTGAQQITGYTAKEIIGRHFSVFYLPEEAVTGKPENELKSAAVTGRYEEEGWRRRKDGSRFWSSVIVTAVRDEDGVLRGFSKVTRDMTERKQAEERKRLLAEEQAARAEAEAANRAKDQFLSIVSHELRTPLNAILGWASLLRSGRLDDETAAQAFETIERCSRVQSRLVEDLLDVSRMLAGKMFIDSQPLELRNVVESVVNRMRPQVEEKELELDVQCEGVGVVKGDSVRLEQVLGNLISNAIKFTPNGGRICVEMRETDTQVELHVSDNGEGIPPEVLPFVFDHFRQADSSQTRSYGGLGLGLAIARYVVESLHGTITAQSPGKGKGATFIIRLPLYDSSAEIPARTAIDTIENNHSDSQHQTKQAASV